MPTSKYITQKAKHSITGGGLGSFARKLRGKLTFKKTPKLKPTSHNTRAYNEFTHISRNDTEYAKLELQIQKLTEENNRLNAEVFELKKTKQDNKLDKADKSNDKTIIANIQQECDKKLKEKDAEILRQSEFGQKAFNRKEYYKDLHTACVAGGKTITKEKAELHIKIKQLEENLNAANKQLELCKKTESMDLKQISDLRQQLNDLTVLIKELQTKGNTTDFNTGILVLMQNLKHINTLIEKQNREQKLNANIMALLSYVYEYDEYVKKCISNIYILLNQDNNNLNMDQELFGKLMDLIGKFGEKPKLPKL